MGRPQSIGLLANASATLVLSFSNARLYIAISRESECGIFGCPFWVAAGPCEAGVVADCASAPRDEVACASALRDVVFLVRRLGVVLVSFAAIRQYVFLREPGESKAGVRRLLVLEKNPPGLNNCAPFALWMIEHARSLVWPPK